MKANVQRSSFGKLPDGTAVDLYTLTNANGLALKVATYGTIITELHVPDRAGELADVVLGFDNLDQYLKGHPYFGCTVGRVANRIAKGKFTLDGKLVLISDLGNNALVVVDSASRKVVKRLNPGRQPEGILMSPDGARAYIAVAGEKNVAILDLKTLEVSARIPTGAGPDGMACAVRR